MKPADGHGPRQVRGTNDVSAFKGVNNIATDTNTAARLAGTVAVERDDLEKLEIELLLEGIYRIFGYDFRQYAETSIRRRIRTFMESEGLPTVSSLQDFLLHDSGAFRRFLLALSVNVTSLFRDPEFFLAMRQVVAPILKTYPFIRIWHAGCSSGEEVYSMAILLMEEGLYDRCRIYATDMDESVLQQAREGIFPLEATRKHVGNYHKSGGKGELSDYFTAAYGHAIFRSTIRSQIVFSKHNLATDGSFNEFNVILCRNVMIYFSKPLQERVHSLLYESLPIFGILAIGSKETLRFTPHERSFEQLVPGCKLYRRLE